VAHVRRAKIVCTLGPASSSLPQLAALVAAGMDVARLNLSHGTHADHAAVYVRVRQAADAAGRGVGILADLQGPKIRVGTFTAGPVMLEAGQRFVITTAEVPGDAHRASTTYAGLPGDCSPGDRILVDYGKVALEVVEVIGTDVVTTVVEAGPVSDHKGLNRQASR
jgi:pyruvate kinase